MMLSEAVVAFLCISLGLSMLFHLQFQLFGEEIA